MAVRFGHWKVYDGMSFTLIFTTTRNDTTIHRHTWGWTEGTGGKLGIREIGG